MTVKKRRVPSKTKATKRRVTRRARTIKSGLKTAKGRSKLSRNRSKPLVAVPKAVLEVFEADIYEEPTLVIETEEEEVLI